MTQAPQATRTEVIACPHCSRRNRVQAAAAGVPRCGNCHQALPWLTQASDTDFQDVVAQSTLPVLADLWAPWCGPCRVVAPGVERAAQTFAGRLKAVKINVDESPQTAARYQAQSIPLLLLLDHGKVRPARSAPPHQTHCCAGWSSPWPSHQPGDPLTRHPDDTRYRAGAPARK